MQPSAFTIKSNSGILNQLTTIVSVVIPNTKNAFQVKVYGILAQQLLLLQKMW